MPDSPTDVVHVVSVTDPAIDLAAMGEFDGVNEYASSRDPALLRWKPGMSEQSATWITLVPISNRAFGRFVKPCPTLEKRWEYAFLAAVRGVRGWRNIAARGPFHAEPWMPNTRTRVKQIDLEVWPEEVLEVVTDHLVEDIGKWVYDRTKLGQDTVDFFDLPPGCAALMWPRISRAVTQARAIARLARTQSEGGRSEVTTGATASENNGPSEPTSPDPSP